MGIAGLGRSGWDIHARALEQMSDQFQIVAVMDLDGARRAEAADKFGCQTYDDFSLLASDPSVESIVVATPNFLHTAHTIEALQKGKHVVCEKPFGADSGEADAMIEAAVIAEKLVAPFQNRRYEPHFLKVKEIIESGVLGEIQLIRIAWHGFKRRWDWQTLSEFGGGELSNAGAHVIDHALRLFGEAEPQVTTDLRNVLSSGDAEDHIKIVLQAPDAPTIDIEIASDCAFPQDRWLIMGSQGGLRGTTSHLEWKWIDWDEYESHSVDREPPKGRDYAHEKLNWNSGNIDVANNFSATPLDFYADFARSVREGAPLAITPQSVRRNTALIEACRRLAPVKQGQFALSSSD